MRVARTVAVMALATLGAVAGVAQDVKTCHAQYEKDLAALAEERQATIKSLSEVYADNLESLLAQAKKDGDAALQQESAGELDRIRKGEAVSGGEPPKHPDLKAARAKHEETLRLRDRGVARKIDDLTKVCDRSLEKLADSLAIRGRPDEATDARMARTTLNSRRAVTLARRLLAERGACRGLRCPAGDAYAREVFADPADRSEGPCAGRSQRRALFGCGPVGGRGR